MMQKKPHEAGNWRLLKPMNATAIVLSKNGNMLTKEGDQKVIDIIKKTNNSITNVEIYSGKDFNRLKALQGMLTGDANTYVVISFAGKGLVHLEKTANQEISDTITQAISDGYRGSSWDLLRNMLGLDENGNKINP